MASTVESPFCCLTSLPRSEIVAVLVMDPHVLVGCNALVTEDDKDNAEMLAEMLELSGASVRVAATGLETLEIVRSWAPRFLLLDIGLPDMTGYDLMQVLRSQRALRSAHFLAVTAYASETDRCRALAAGFDAYVSKPVDHATLLQLLTRMKEEQPPASSTVLSVRCLTMPPLDRRARR